MASKSYEDRLRELHKNDDRPGKPTSTSQEKQNGTRNYLKEAFDKHTGGDLSKLKATNMMGRRILAVANGKGQWTKEKAMAERKAAAQAQGKGNWTKEGAMAERKAAAQAKKQKKQEWAKSNEDQYRTESGVWQNPNGKKKFNSQDEMKKRREAAKAAGKGNWNAQEEMRKRREAAMANKRK